MIGLVFAPPICQPSKSVAISWPEYMHSKRGCMGGASDNTMSGKGVCPTNSKKAKVSLSGQPAQVPNAATEMSKLRLAISEEVGSMVAAHNFSCQPTQH